MRNQIGMGDTVQSRADPQLQQRLLGALQDRLSIVQMLRRRHDGTWRVLHGGGSRGLDEITHKATEGELHRLLGWVCEEDRERISLALLSVAEGIAYWNGRCRMALPDGESAWVEVEIERQLCDDDDDGVVVIALAREMSAQHQVEQELAQLRERWELASVATGIGTLTFDVARQTVHLDAAAAQQHGRGATASGMTLDEWVSLFFEDDQLKAHTLLRSGVPPDQTESLTLRVPRVQQGPVCLLELALRSTADGSRFIGACRDVTQERSLEEMRRKKLAAEKANKSKSEFMSHVSHELRTPLNGILGFAQLMAMDTAQPLPPEQGKRLEVLSYSARRLLTLIDKLLEISKIERGKQTLRLRAIDVPAILKLCIEQIQPLANARGIGITVDIDPNEQPPVRADAGALEQVLINLLSNAVKYNRERGKVRIRYVADDVGRIVVDDTGRGISDSELGRLFEPFNRLSATKTEVPGHGLGLVISKQLIERMQGQMQVTSKEGVGSRFVVQLPLASGAADEIATTLPLDLPSQWETGRQYNVLYIEDDEVNTILMEQVFRTQPEWTLTTATSGAEGINAALRQRPEVILLDLHLPDMPGIEVFRRLRDDPRTRAIPCVAVSADALPAHVRRNLTAGFEDYWTKPLELTTLIARLKLLLR